MSKDSKANVTSSSTAPEIDFSSPGSAIEGIESLLETGQDIDNSADEVWPNLYIGNMEIAKDCEELKRCCFTHVLNCADSSSCGKIYDGMGITYMGIDAEDTLKYNMSAHFNNAAEFIHTALEEGGKILVHCHLGVSRSATIVFAYLMLKQNMTLVEAIKKVKEGRGVYPNRGFLRQLIDFHIQLYGNRS